MVISLLDLPAFCMIARARDFALMGIGLQQGRREWRIILR
jgi:hypothetical protein